MEPIIFSEITLCIIKTTASIKCTCLTTFDMWVPNRIEVVSLKSNMKLFNKIKRMSCVLLGMFILILPLVVETTLFNSKFGNVHLIFGTSISNVSGVTSVFDCLRTCGDTCGYVQYTPDVTCVLYSQAVLLTEPAGVEGKIHGYRKIRLVIVYHTQILI